MLCNMATLRVIIAFLALVFAALSQEADPVDAWTLFNSSISCGASCKYDFFVRKQNSGEEFHCHLERPGQLDPTVFILEETCHEEPLFTISLTWGIDGSAMFCITDIDEKRIAFYALDSWEIYNGVIAPKKTESAWPSDQLPAPNTLYIPPTVAPDFDYRE
ncbi:hypothetical protein F5Y06DRAFT_278553 [Hypoxylon sp. FL0890]|nr:hypothetical protein F5Y06DRAFT_278553 [Hypoxylon sp. FL0890]